MKMKYQASKLEEKVDSAPTLIVVVDTEEEFDWSKPPDRSKTSVTHMEQLHLTQDICQQYGLNPCYVIDYPIASTQLSIEILKAYANQGQCEIGAHLHPWVTPPMVEELSFRNMYPGNLDYDAEHDKLSCLTNKIEESFGEKPVSYKAGRYGFGPNTLEIVTKLGFKVDLSYCPPIDHSADGGPDYSACHSRPFKFDNSELIGIPITGAFTGIFGTFSDDVYRLSQKLEFAKAPGILSRLNVLDRLVLTPEGYSSDEHIKLVKFLFNQGQRIFTWSFHSPTVVPGHTDYVQNAKEQQEYLDKFKRFFDFFFNDLNGEASTPSQIQSAMEHAK